jgi:heme/copper-type cytochrome/quinol oxidase subunit 2
VPNLAAEGQAAEASTPLSALWWVFLAVLLAILAVESFLGLRFGHYVRRMPSALELSR